MEIKNNSEKFESFKEILTNLSINPSEIEYASKSIVKFSKNLTFIKILIAFLLTFFLEQYLTSATEISTNAKFVIYPLILLYVIFPRYKIRPGLIMSNHQKQFFIISGIKIHNYKTYSYTTAFTFSRNDLDFNIDWDDWTHKINDISANPMDILFPKFMWILRFKNKDSLKLMEPKKISAFNQEIDYEPIGSKLLPLKEFKKKHNF